MSSRPSNHLDRVLQGREEFASDVAFEAAYDLGLAQALRGAATHVCPGLAIMTKPDEDDAIQSRVGLSVAATVEPMPVGLSRGGGYRIDPAQRGEGSLRVKTFRVTPGSDQEGRRRVGSYAEDAEQGWRCRLGESFELSL